MSARADGSGALPLGPLFTANGVALREGRGLARPADLPLPPVWRPQSMPRGWWSTRAPFMSFDAVNNAVIPAGKLPLAWIAALRRLPIGRTGIKATVEGSARKPGPATA